MFKRVWNVCFALWLECAKRKSNGGKTNIVSNDMQNDEIFIKWTWFQFQTGWNKDRWKLKLKWHFHQTNIVSNEMQTKYSWNERRFKRSLRSMRMQYFCFLSIHLILWSTCREEEEQASFAFWIRSLSVSQNDSGESTGHVYLFSPFWLESSAWTRPIFTAVDRLRLEDVHKSYMYQSSCINNAYEVTTPTVQSKVCLRQKKRAGICLQTFSKRILTLAKDFLNVIQTDLKRRSSRQKTNLRLSSNARVKWYMANDFLNVLQTDLGMLKRTCVRLQKFSKQRYGQCWQTVFKQYCLKFV
jgi:hypothetical protein